MIMKRMISFSTLLLIIAMSFALTSCDDDDPWDYDYSDYYGDWYDDYNWYQTPFDYGTSALNEEAQMLRGHWTGTLTDYYIDDSGNKAQAQMNADVEFDQYDSKSLNGRGVEYDYVNNDSQTLKFSWYIDPRSGDIYIKYDSSSNVFKLDVQATTDGFYLDQNNFNGTMTRTDNNEVIDFSYTRTTLAKPNISSMTRSAAGTNKSSAPMKLRMR